MLKTYEIGGIPVEVHTADDGSFDDGILAPFLCPPGTVARYTLDIACADVLPPPEGVLIGCDNENRVYRLPDGETHLRYVGAIAESTDGAYLYIRRTGTRMTALYKGAYLTPKLILSAVEGEHLITAHGGILLHASCICVNGEAILFTAPSGTGKSTQAALWRRYRCAEVINGDRIAVFCGEDGAPRVRGVPYSGSSGISHAANLPLRAIVYLSQGTENRCRRLRGMDAFRAIWEGCCVNTWLRADVDAASLTVSRIVGGAPVCSFACTPDEHAVNALEATLQMRANGG